MTGNDREAFIIDETLCLLVLVPLLHGIVIKLRWHIVIVEVQLVVVHERWSQLALLKVRLKVKVQFYCPKVDVEEVADVRG